MKKFIPLFFLVFSISLLSAQSIVSTFPNSGPQGGTGMLVEITGAGTNFNQATTTYAVTFTQGTSTINGYAVTAGSATALYSRIDIPASATTGSYNLMVSGGGASMTLNNAFTVLAPHSISAITPNNAQQGASALSVQISGANFNQASSAYSLSFSQASATAFYGNIVSVNSTTSITATVSVPLMSNAGVYDVVLSGGGLTKILNGGFTVTPGPQPQITSVDTNYASSGTTLDVTISGVNTHFQSGTSTSVWFSQGSATIYPNSISIINGQQLSANFTLANTYPIGFYDVHTYNQIDYGLVKTNGFFISDTAVHLVSVGGTGYSTQGGTAQISITGTGTNFGVPGTTTTVWLGQTHNRSQAANIFPVSTQIVSTTQINATFNFAPNEKTGYYDVYVLNTLDGQLVKERGFNLLISGIGTIDADQVRVYPNPTSGKIYIDLTNPKNVVRFSLTSINGSVVLDRAATGESQEQLDIRNIESGIYILSVIDSSGAVQYKKVVIE